MNKPQHERKPGRVALGTVSRSTHGTGAKPFESIGLRNDGIEL
jgi:hypothetical protein